MDEIAEIKKAMDEYGNFAHARELLKSEKKQLIDSIIPPEIQIEIESIEFETKEKEEVLDKKEKEARKKLDSLIKKYIKNLDVGKEKIHLSSEMMNLTISEPETVWDTSALDAFIIAGHRELLPFRSQTLPKTRLTKKGM